MVCLLMSMTDNQSQLEVDFNLLLIQITFTDQSV